MSGTVNPNPESSEGLLPVVASIISKSVSDTCNNFHIFKKKIYENISILTLLSKKFEKLNRGKKTNQSVFEWHMWLFLIHKVCFLYCIYFAINLSHIICVVNVDSHSIYKKNLLKGY